MWEKWVSVKVICPIFCPIFFRAYLLLIKVLAGQSSLMLCVRFFFLECFKISLGVLCLCYRLAGNLGSLGSQGTATKALLFPGHPAWPAPALQAPAAGAPGGERTGRPSEDPL